MSRPGKMLRRRQTMKRGQFSAFKSPLARLGNLYQFFNLPTWMLASRSPASSNLCQVLPPVSSDLRQAPGHEISNRQTQSPSSLFWNRGWGRTIKGSDLQRGRTTLSRAEQSRLPVSTVGNWTRFIFLLRAWGGGHDRGKPCHYYRRSEAIPVWDRSGVPRGCFAKNALHPSPFGDLPGWARIAYT